MIEKQDVMDIDDAADAVIEDIIEWLKEEADHDDVRALAEKLFDDQAHLNLIRYQDSWDYYIGKENKPDSFLFREKGA